MSRKRILIASSNCWTSDFQVGSHHLARGFLQAGWQVAYLSDPISPWHLLSLPARDLWRRIDIRRRGGLTSPDGNFWSYVPFAWMTPHNRPLLRSAYVHRNWQHWTTPGLIAQVRRHGFGHVDLLYVDSFTQSFWFDALSHVHGVYRVPDYHPQFAKYTAAARQLEMHMARRAHWTLYPSHHLKDYVDGLGAARSCHFPNGVDYQHFSTPRPAPAVYRELSGPIAVYLGNMAEWFGFDWVAAAARALPDVSFVLLGPPDLAHPRLGGLPNVHVLGMKDHDEAPAYLQHAHVGLMPFDLARNPLGVAALNPQKLYAYLAAGIPVVSSSWPELRRLGSPARLCATSDEFNAAIRAVTQTRTDPDSLRRYAANFDWKQRVQSLIDIVSGAIPAQAG